MVNHETAVSSELLIGPCRPSGLGGWVAVSMILVYVAFSCCGLLTVPWTMTAEMYPDHLRDVGQAVTLLIANMLMFAGLQLYPVLRSVLREYLTG